VTGAIAGKRITTNIAANNGISANEARNKIDCGEHRSLPNRRSRKRPRGWHPHLLQRAAPPTRRGRSSGSFPPVRFYRCPRRRSTGGSATPLPMPVGSDAREGVITSTRCRGTVEVAHLASYTAGRACWS
jgi:hypothetical protein